MHLFICKTCLQYSAHILTSFSKLIWHVLVVLEGDFIIQFTLESESWMASCTDFQRMEAHQTYDFAFMNSPIHQLKQYLIVTIQTREF